MPIYLDHAASTRPEAEVVSAVSECMLNVYANPSSAYAAAGEARREMRRCRRVIASMAGCDPAGVILTSGGTESNNIVLRSAAGRHVVLSAGEHSSVLEAARAWGCDVTLAPLDDQGVVQADAVERALRSDTALIALQWANNETGVLQPVEAVGRLARERRIPFHADAVQAFGHVPVSLRWCDSLSLSAHKFCGPRGAGALCVRQGVKLQPLISGGGQEMNLRAGTENVPAVCGMRVAAEMAAADMQERSRREGELMQDLLRRLTDRIPGARLLGEKAQRLPGVAAVYLPGLSSEMAIAQLDLMGVMVSGGAACAASSAEASHVYRAMELTEKEARQVIRISAGRHTTGEETAAAAEAIVAVWEKYRD
ncbi:MAG: cysteine desulfurase [Clostridia bacterium]|nr:cysteine desulfurase [Clostridia bacterium]